MPRGPALELSWLSPRSSPALPAPLTRTVGVRFYGYARMGLYEGLGALRIGAGENVLLPGFICNSVLAPFHARGIEARFYDVDAGLCPRFETIEPLVDRRTRALLAVHYFGVPQDSSSIGEFCRQHRIAYIEDNAHGFLSAQGGRPLGTFGDIAVFSFRKTIPLPHGAALVANRGDLLLPPPRPAPVVPARDLLTFALRDSARRIEILAHLDLVSRFRRRDGTRDGAGEADEEFAPVSQYDAGYSVLADAIARRTPLDRVRRVRRACFQFWLDRTADLAALGGTPIFSTLERGVVPYGFPLHAQDPRRLSAALAREGVSCSIWPALPRKIRAEGGERPVVVIPVHRHPLTRGVR